MMLHKWVYDVAQGRGKDGARHVKQQLLDARTIAAWREREREREVNNASHVSV